MYQVARLARGWEGLGAEGRRVSPVQPGGLMGGLGDPDLCEAQPGGGQGGPDLYEAQLHPAVG